MLGPEKALPLPLKFSSTDEYVESLLSFVASSQSLQTLCGGVHILDFFTRTPDLYCTIIPEDWRIWFDHHDVQDILDFLNKEEAADILEKLDSQEQGIEQWRGKPLPPRTLVQYVADVQKHCLDTAFTAASDLTSFRQKSKPAGKYVPSLKAMTQGMSPKKMHEVSNFSHFVSDLADKIQEDESTPISHIVDFGSGQNYLGRTLASEPYCKDIIAVESRPHVVQGAIRMDSRVNLVDQKLVIRNKKMYRSQKYDSKSQTQVGIDTATSIIPAPGKIIMEDISNTSAAARLTAEDSILRAADATIGRVQYIQHRIEDGDLSEVVCQIPPKDSNVCLDEQSPDPSLIVISLHSCGNLLHHGLRALTLNPTVRAVAMIGCCYNMLTERSCAPTSTIPLLRETHPRLYEPSTHNDPHGFPMSTKLLTYKQASASEPIPNHDRTPQEHESAQTPGIHLNITARMMAVQAPRNWTPETSTSFFTRHFYRALLQRIFMDRGIIAPPRSAGIIDKGRSPAGTGSTALDGTAPVVIGNLARPCYGSFVKYVHGAVAKLEKMAIKPKEVDGWNDGDAVARQYRNAVAVAKLARARVGSMSEEEISGYEAGYSSGKKQLSIVWSLMAFSAQVIEAVIVVDRWLWLKEQDCVEEAWVQTVFDYAQSPRNMCVIGIKKNSSRVCSNAD